MGGSETAANSHLRITSAANKAAPQADLLRIDVESLVCILRAIFFHGLG
jgi:hypothetical protein